MIELQRNVVCITYIENNNALRYNDVEQIFMWGKIMKNRIKLLSIFVIVILCAVISIVMVTNFSNEKEASQTTTQMDTSSKTEILNYIGTIIDSLAQTPAAEYYDPSDFIDKNSEDYKYLINNSDLTAKYIFNIFLETRRFNTVDSQTSKEERIMGAVLKDILGSESLRDTDYAGRDYFDEFWIRNVRLLLLNDEEYMEENYKYGYLLIQLSREKLVSLFSDTNRAEEIDRRINFFERILSYEEDIAITDIISSVTNSEYLGSAGSGITIHKFSYSDSLTFNVSVKDEKIVCAVYYIDGKEYAYSGANGHGTYTVSENTNNVDNSDNVKILANDDKMKNLVVSELKKSKYKDYVTKFDENDLEYATLCYRVNTESYEFVYNADVEYSYVFGLRINDDDSEYNECKVVVDAQTGQITAVYFSNYYDNV